MTHKMRKMWVNLSLALTGCCTVPSCSQDSQEFASLLRRSDGWMLGFDTCRSLLQFTAAKVSCETLVWMWKWALALLFPLQCEQDTVTFTTQCKMLLVYLAGCRNYCYSLILHLCFKNMSTPLCLYHMLCAYSGLTENYISGALTLLCF